MPFPAGASMPARRTRKRCAASSPKKPACRSNRCEPLRELPAARLAAATIRRSACWSSAAIGPAGTLRAGDDADAGRLVQARRDAGLAGHPVGARNGARDRSRRQARRRMSSESSCTPVPCGRQNHRATRGYGQVWAYLAIAIAASPLAAAPAAAASAEAPFEQPLMRLAEVLGSLHYLRNLCGEAGNQWRNEMEQLLASENPQARAAGALRRQLQPRLPLLRRRLRRLHGLGDRGDQPLHEGRRGAVARHRDALRQLAGRSLKSLLTFPPSAKYRGDFLC